MHNTSHNIIILTSWVSNSVRQQGSI